MKRYTTEFLYTTYHQYTIDPVTGDFSWGEEAEESVIDIHVTLSVTPDHSYGNRSGYDIDYLSMYIADKHGRPNEELPVEESRLTNIDYDNIIEKGIERINDEAYEARYGER